MSKYSLPVNVLHHYLEAIEAASLGGLNFIAETFDKVLVNNAVRGGKESEHMADEMAETRTLTCFAARVACGASASSRSSYWPGLGS